MGSFHENAFALFLQRRHIPFLIDLLVMPMRNDLPLEFWASQMDVVTFNNYKDTEFPIDWELDDDHHFTVKGMHKDQARDNRLMSSEYWKVRRPPKFDYKDIDNQKPWVIVRIPYPVIDKMVRNKTNSKGALYSLKDSATKLISQTDSIITEALRAKEPKRMLWPGYY